MFLGEMNLKFKFIKVFIMFIFFNYFSLIFFYNFFIMSEVN